MKSHLLAALTSAVLLASSPVAFADQGVPPGGLQIAPGLVVNNISITQGRLVINGVTTPVGQVVVLEQRFQVRSDALGRFSFRLIYTTDDCVVDISTNRGMGHAQVGNCGLQGDTGPVGPTGQTGPRGAKGDKGDTGATGATGARGPAGAAGTPGVQGPPGPAGAGVTPRGDWDAETSYAVNDLVYHEGSTWRATQANSDEEPGGESPWVLFAQRGAQGPTGSGGAMFAVVNPNGTWSRGYPADDGYESQKVEQPTGTYEVLFGSNDITSCAFLATVGSSAYEGVQTPGFVTVVGRALHDNGVFVQTFNTSGALADLGFHLAINCAPSD